MFEVIFYFMLRLLFAFISLFKITKLLIFRERNIFKYLKNRKKLEYKEYNINYK